MVKTQEVDDLELWEHEFFREKRRLDGNINHSLADDTDDPTFYTPSSVHFDHQTIAFCTISSIMDYILDVFDPVDTIQDTKGTMWLSQEAWLSSFRHLACFWTEYGT